MNSTAWQIGLYVGLAIAAIAATAIVYFRTRKVRTGEAAFHRAKRGQVANTVTIGPEIAFIFERTELNGSAWAAALIMLIFNLLMVANLFLSGGKTVFQETAGLLLWIVGNQVLALIVLLGQRRSYIVRDAVHPPHDPQGMAHAQRLDTAP